MDSCSVADQIVHINKKINLELMNMFKESIPGFFLTYRRNWSFINGWMGNMHWSVHNDQ